MARADCERCQRIFRSSLVVLAIIIASLAWLNRDKFEDGSVSQWLSDLTDTGVVADIND